ncbi:MAG TPA: hypothetical protein VLT47_13795 [Anaeromyxobacteraceae bacterium]|nr:hypothetical protein [Anaeromyxobacteraceae bacterium]
MVGPLKRALWLRGRPWILVGAVAFAAALVDLGSFHRLEDGDSIVPILVSLQRWTPFYWDQERYGMLVPLLALPVRDPLWNLLVQRWLLAIAGLSVPILVARHVLADRGWVLAGLLSSAGLLLFWPARWSFDFLGSQPYGLSMAVALAGLAIAEPGARWGGPWLRRGAGLTVVLAAHWVNAAAGLVLLPLAAARAAVDWQEGEDLRRIRERIAVDGALLVTGLGAGVLFTRIRPPTGPYSGWSYSQVLPASEWVGAVASFARSVAWASGPWPAFVALSAAAGLLLMAHPAVRPALRSALFRTAALVGAAVAYACAIALLRWVGENAWHPRYFAPAAVLVQVAAVGLLAEPLGRLRAIARPVGLAALVLLPVAAVAAWGAPSLAAVRRDLDRVAGARTEAILDARCDLVAGDYWTVWPSVWHANGALAERGEPRRIWGVAHRCSPTAPQWQALPRQALRICVAHGEEKKAERWLERCGAGRARPAERGAAVDVWALEPAAP